MELQQKSDSISYYIRKCNKIIHEKGHEIAQEYGLTYDQHHLLIYLNKSERAPTIKDVSNKFNRAQNTISEKVSRLEEKGLVERCEDTEDRRITRVCITKKGKDLVNTIKQERSNRVIYKALAKMEEEDVDELLNNLTKLHDILTEEG